MVYVHPVRSVICAFETCLIVQYKKNEEFRNRLANVKEDFDDHITFEDSDEESVHAAGPHCLYITHGLPGPKHRP